MIHLAAVQAAFPELRDVTVLVESGQKHVLLATRNGAEVVLKLIKPNQNAEAVRREILAVANLNRSYIPPVIDSGLRKIESHERLYIIEPRVNGESYRDRLVREPKPSVDFVIQLADFLLRACCDFESLKIVHRDLKPENLLIEVGGKVWVIDFGIARLLDATSLTPTRQRFGKFTPGYGAPEQLRNLKAQINARADLFSVGVVLYESLAGFQPYYVGTQDEMEVIRRVTEDDLPHLVLPVNQAFADFVMFLCARFPSRRPQTAADALQCFQAVAS
jgi:serine/threonine-protein kinase